LSGLYDDGTKKWRPVCAEEGKSRPFIKQALELASIFGHADMYAIGASEKVFFRGGPDGLGPSRDKLG